MDDEIFQWKNVTQADVHELKWQVEFDLIYFIHVFCQLSKSEASDIQKSKQTHTITHILKITLNSKCVPIFVFFLNLLKAKEHEVDCFQPSLWSWHESKHLT